MNFTFFAIKGYFKKCIEIPLFLLCSYLPPVNPHSVSAYGKGIDRLIFEFGSVVL